MQSIQADIELCRQEYKKQKILAQIVSERPLKRPNTKKIHVILLFLTVPLLLLGSIFFAMLLPIGAAFKALILSALLFFLSELYLRFCLLKAVNCYQHYAKKETRQRCMCVPSCSEYAVICLSKIFPLIVALIKIRIRLYRTCKGECYVLDYPLKKMNNEFEKNILNKFFE